MIDDLTTIVVLFNPTETQISNVQRLADICHVIAVDNSSFDISKRLTLSSIDYIPLFENKGLAAAQNVAIKKVIKYKCRFILFQDQDSQLQVGDIQSLIEEYKRIKHVDGMVAAIGPIVINQTDGKEYKSELKKNVITGKVSSLISSGMLVETDLFINVGMMEETLFIDNVDHEWCWRAQDKGYGVYMTRKSILQHSVGMSMKRVAGMQIIKSAPFRTYYKYRNNILLLKRSYVPWEWKMKTFIHMVLDYVTNLIHYKSYGKENLEYANRGIIEAKNLI